MDAGQPRELRWRLCVFCGSSSGARPAYVQVARSLGRLMVQQGIGLVFGGGGVGLMGAVADGVLEAGGEVIGVIPHGLVAREAAHRGVADLRVVNTMHERKALMASLADGFLALPGGFGTLEELFEIITWLQLGIHAKPVALLDVEGFFEPLWRHVERSVAEGFVKPHHAASVLVESDAGRLLQRIRAVRPDPGPRWLEPSQT